MTVSCAHLDTITVARPTTEIAGCQECLATGGWWVHLRACRACGHVGCCDSSPNRHATAHATTSKHPIISSIEAGEDWSYCYIDDVAFVFKGDDAPKP